MPLIGIVLTLHSGNQSGESVMPDQADLWKRCSDNNHAPSGANGDHLGVAPFSAKVGDQDHIVARNGVPGSCQLGEIWLHCIEGRGGKVKLADRISPAECRRDVNRIGTFSIRRFATRTGRTEVNDGGLASGS